MPDIDDLAKTLSSAVGEDYKLFRALSEYSYNKAMKRGSKKLTPSRDNRSP